MNVNDWITLNTKDYPQLKAPPQTETLITLGTFKYLRFVSWFPWLPRWVKLLARLWFVGVIPRRAKS